MDAGSRVNFSPSNDSNWTNLAHKPCWRFSAMDRACNLYRANCQLIVSLCIYRCCPFMLHIIRKLRSILLAVITLRSGHYERKIWQSCSTYLTFMLFQLERMWTGSVKISRRSRGVKIVNKYKHMYCQRTCSPSCCGHFMGRNSVMFD